MRRPIPAPPHVDVWEEFEQDFIQDWDDTNAHYKAAAELDKLKMEGVTTVRPELLFFFSFPFSPSPYYEPPFSTLRTVRLSLLSITRLTLAPTVLHTHASVPADVHPLCTFHVVFPHRYLMYHCTLCARLPAP